MSFGSLEVGHVNVTVSPEMEEATKHFYGQLLGLEQIEKPDGPRKYVGAWYQAGNVQLHLSVEENGRNNDSDRHVCYLVDDVVETEQRLRSAAVEIIADTERPSATPRFFIRDPGGNLIEIAKK